MYECSEQVLLLLLLLLWAGRGWMRRWGRRDQLWFVTGPFDGAQKRSSRVAAAGCAHQKRAVRLASRGQGSSKGPAKKLCRVEPCVGDYDRQLVVVVSRAGRMVVEEEDWRGRQRGLLTGEEEWNCAGAHSGRMGEGVGQEVVRGGKVWRRAQN